MLIVCRSYDLVTVMCVVFVSCAVSVQCNSGISSRGFARSCTRAVTGEANAYCLFVPDCCMFLFSFRVNIKCCSHIS